MLDNLFDNQSVLFSILVFTAILLLLEGVYLLWRGHYGAQTQHLRRRLTFDRFTPGDPSSSAAANGGFKGAVGRVVRTLRHTPASGWLARMLQQADLGWSVPTLLIGCATTATGGWLVAVPVLDLPLGIALGATGSAAYLPVGFVQWRRNRRMSKIERQLPDALDLITRAVRAGHAFSAALKMAGDDMPEPIGAELRLVNDEITFGVRVSDALTHLTERVPLTDIRFFVLAVVIQRDSGGNLTEILINLSRLIRERHKLFARVRVLSAEGRLSAWIMGLMPFALGGLLTLLNPTFMALLWTDPIGITILQYTLAAMAIGAVVLSRIVRVRF